MSKNTKLLSDSALLAIGFSADEIQAAINRKDPYVGEKDGVKYFRSQQELNIDLGEHKTHEVRLPIQQGDFE